MSLASRAVSTIFFGTRLSLLRSRSQDIGRLNPSSVERKAEGQTTSPVFELTSCDPNLPGITINGRLPTRSRAPAEPHARFGVRFPRMQPDNTAVKTRRKERAARRHA